MAAAREYSARPTVYIIYSLTHSHSCERSVRIRERTRETRFRPRRQLVIVRTLIRLTRVSRSLHAPVPIYVSACRAEPRRQRSHAAKRGRIRAHDDSSDLETNDRSTNNGYAFFRDVLKWSRSVVPRARPIRPPPPRSSIGAAVKPNITEHSRGRARQFRTVLRDARRISIPFNDKVRLLGL